MRTLLIAALFGLSFVLKAQNTERNFIDQPYIEVNGRNEIEIVPDRIYLTIVLSEKDNKSKLSIAELEKVMFASLKKIGIDVSADLQLKDFSSSFKNQFILKTDIILSKEYQLVVHDGNTVGKVMAELEKAGISNVTFIKAEHSKIEQYRKEVKANAMKSAKENAEILATSIGQTIGKAIYIQEQYINIYAPRSEKRTAMLAGAMINDAEPAEEPIDFEKIKLEYSVLVRFILQ